MNAIFCDEHVSANCEGCSWGRNLCYESYCSKQKNALERAEICGHDVALRARDVLQGRPVRPREGGRLLPGLPRDRRDGGGGGYAGSVPAERDPWDGGPMFTLTSFLIFGYYIVISGKF